MVDLRRARNTLLFTVFLDLLGFGIVIPLLPLYATKLHASHAAIGWLMAIYSIMQLIFAPILGRLSDRTGRRPTLLISIAGSALSQFGYALAPSFGWLVVARGFAGLCGANITAAQAYIADITDEQSRAAGMGMLGAALGLGFVFGPALGGVLAKYSMTLPFWVAGALAAANLGSALAFLSEPRPPHLRAPARTLTWTGLLDAVVSPTLRRTLLLYFLVTFSFTNLEATFSVFLHDRFGFEEAHVGYLFAFIGVTIFVVQGGLVKKLVPRFGERALVVVGTLLMAVGLLWQAESHSLTTLILAVGIIAVGNALNTPSLTALISRAAAAHHQGGVLGVAQSLGALARATGPLVGMWLYHVRIDWPYVAGSLLMALGCLYAYVLVRQPDQPVRQPDAAG